MKNFTGSIRREMRNSYKLTALILLSAFFTACSGDNAENKASTNANSSIASAQTNSYVASNGETMQPAFNGDTKNVGNGLQIPANATVVNVNSQTTKPEEPMKSETPAADNSTYSAEMNDKGQPVETRTFKSHPILAKVEKITLSPRDYVYKVYLKDGKVVESKSEELKLFRFIAPENILEAINKLPPKPTPDPNDPTRDGKKKPSMMQVTNQ